MIEVRYSPQYTVTMMPAKEFSKRIHDCFNDWGAPTPIRERAILLSKMLHIPTHQAWLFLEGQQLPDEPLLAQIAREFEVTPQWLKGELARKH